MRIIAIFSLMVLCVCVMGSVMLLRLRDLGSATLGLQDNATTLMQFGGFSSDFERLARLDVTGQLDLPADARQRLQTEEAAIRHDMDRLWTAYMPSISPGERSEEHTSELQSLMRISYAVFCLKKKNIHTQKKVTD